MCMGSATMAMRRRDASRRDLLIARSFQNPSRPPILQTAMAPPLTAMDPGQWIKFRRIPAPVRRWMFVAFSLVWRRGDRRQVLRGRRSSSPPGRVVLLTRALGMAGKTTLSPWGGLRQVQQAKCGCPWGKAPEGSSRGSAALRRQIAHEFPGPHPLRCLSAEQNVQMAPTCCPGLELPGPVVIRRAEWLRAVGRATRWPKAPPTTSPVPEAAVAIARALAAHPRLLLADETHPPPFDSRSGRDVVGSSSEGPGPRAGLRRAAGDPRPAHLDVA